MIGEALKILLTAPGLSVRIGDRVFPTIVPQAAASPALYYDDEGVKPLECRVPDGSFKGLIEIGVVAPSPEEVHAILKEIRVVLDGYSGQVAGFGLVFGRGESQKPEYLDNLEEYMQALVYTVSGQQL